MSDSTERQFQEADAAIQRGVTDFMSRIERLVVKCEAVAPAVAPAYIVERLARAHFAVVAVTEEIGTPIQLDFS